MELTFLKQISLIVDEKMKNAFLCVVLFTLATHMGASPVKNEKDLDLAHVVYQKKLNEYLETVPKSVASEAKMSVTELIQHKGYPVETHTVVTVDGYILTLHRIPHGKNNKPGKDKKVVFLQHGILSSSADWVVTGPEHGLGYFMADEGYDVWMGNFRGNKYSRNNTHMTPSMDKFWDFSWHEMGIYDLPTMIDYVLKTTGAKDLFYIGHSQGTTAFYVMASEKPEYNQKIRAQFSLAPIGYMKHLFSPLLRIIAKAEGGIGVILDMIGVHEFLPNTGFLGHVGDILCGDDSMTQLLCTNSLFAICGFSHKQMNSTMLPVLMGHTPSGSATKQFLHYAQLINSGLKTHFRQYDYGLVENKKRYGSITPPEYQVNKVTAPVYLFYSQNDWLSAIVDVDKLWENLGNAKAKFLVPDKKFNHLDYMYGVDARDMVYEVVAALMSRH